MNTKMDLEQAEFIKHLRVVEGYSFRMIHKEWQRRYQKKSDWWWSEAAFSIGIPLPHGNQIKGIKLCAYAQTLLNEKWT